MPKWLDRVRLGDLTALPKSFRWNTSSEVAHLIDGYGLVGDQADVFGLMRHVMAEIEAGRAATLPALDLWIALFLQHCGRRHEGYPPGRAAPVGLDRLCTELREALLRLDDAGRAMVVRQAGIRGEPVGDERIGGTAVAS